MLRDDHSYTVRTVGNNRKYTANGLVVLSLLLILSLVGGYIVGAKEPSKIYIGKYGNYVNKIGFYALRSNVVNPEVSLGDYVVVCSNKGGTVDPQTEACLIKW